MIVVFVLQKGCHILVATPGRLLDFVNRGRITFSSLRFLILDEGDRMLDMGFLPDIEKIMEHPTMVPNVRYTVTRYIIYLLCNIMFCMWPMKCLVLSSQELGVENSC
jgi:hypothetical protein